MTYLAHIAGDGRKQTAAEHLNGTAERCALFAAPFGAEELGRLAGLSHDLGKYSMEFQRRLAGGPKVDHATAGAFACWRMGPASGCLCGGGAPRRPPGRRHSGGFPGCRNLLGTDEARGTGHAARLLPLDRRDRPPLPRSSPLRRGAAVPDVLYPDAVFLSDGRGFPGWTAPPGRSTPPLWMTFGSGSSAISPAGFPLRES